MQEKPKESWLQKITGTSSKESKGAPPAVRDLPDVNEIQSRITARLAVHLEMPADEIDPKQPISVYGMDSVNALKLAGELEDWLDVELPPTLVWDYPTVEHMAHYVADFVRNPVAVEQSLVDFEFQE